jgi:hypothetical protein
LILGAVSKEVFRQIVSHQFHPAIQLEVDGFNEVVLLSEFLDLFPEPRQLRAIELLYTLVEPFDRNYRCPLYIHHAIFKSANTTISFQCRMPFRVMSPGAPSLIAGAVGANNVNVSVELDRNPWSTECETFFRSCVLPFLHESSCLERLTITVNCDRLPFAGNEFR